MLITLLNLFTGDVHTKIVSPEFIQHFNNQIQVTLVDRSELLNKFAKLCKSRYELRTIHNSLRSKNRCNIDLKTARSIAVVFGADTRLDELYTSTVHSGSIDVCDFIASQLPLANLRYRITGITGHGSFGLVFDTISSDGNRYIMKITRTAAGRYHRSVRHIVNINGRDMHWDHIDEQEFLHGVRMQQILATRHWPVRTGVPDVISAVLIKISNTSDERIGMNIMSHIQGVSLLKSMMSKMEKVICIRTLGTLVHHLHSKMHMIHGDLHTGNILVSDLGKKIWLIDFDRTVPVEALYEGHGECETLTKISRYWDIVTLLQRIDQQFHKFFFETYYISPYSEDPRVKSSEKNKNILWEFYQYYVLGCISYNKLKFRIDTDGNIQKSSTYPVILESNIKQLNAELLNSLEY